MRKIQFLVGVMAVTMFVACGTSSPSNTSDLSVVGSNDMALATGDMTGASVDMHQGSGDMAQATGDMAGVVRTFSGDVRPLIDANHCIDCHMSDEWNMVRGAASNSLMVANLKSIITSECASTPFVVAGNADGSYIVQKLRGQGTCFTGARMPYGGPYLSNGDVQKVVDWINAGALDN